MIDKKLYLVNKKIFVFYGSWFVDINKKDLLRMNREKIARDNYYLVDRYVRKYGYIDGYLDVEDIVIGSYYKSVEKYIACSGKYGIGTLMYYEVKHDIYLNKSKEDRIKVNRYEEDIDNYVEDKSGDLYLFEILDKYGEFEREVIDLYLSGYNREYIVKRVGVRKYKVNILINLFLYDIGGKYSEASIKQSGILLGENVFCGEEFGSFDVMMRYLIDNNFFRGDRR